MQANPPLPPPPSRGQDNYSPVSAAGSDWSGMNNYNANLHPNGFHPPPRGESMTPPDTDGNFVPGPMHRAQTYAAGPSSNGEEQDRRGPSGSNSRASSRTASSRASDISLRDPQSRRYQRAEAELRQHYAVLRAYLRGGAAAPPRTNKARDKLLRLSPVQFHELSTDVFDELQRRQAAQPLSGKPPRQDKVPLFLQPRQDFHEKRNQARQKLSSLQTSRFRDLSTDVFCELERRFPHFNPDSKRESTRSQSRGPPGTRPPNGMPGSNGFPPPPRAHTTQGSMSSNTGFPPRKQSVAPLEISLNTPNEFGRPVPKQFQSNTITPNKSTMVEDDDDDDTDNSGHGGRYDRSSEAFGLESSLTSPRSNRDTSATSMTGGSRDVRSIGLPSQEQQDKINDLEKRLEIKDDELSRTANLTQELQDKLEQAEKLNTSLRNEVERMRSEQASIAQGEEWREKHGSLEQEHKSLQQRYEQQMRMTEEVSKQVKAHLVDMRAMADESHGNMQREEQMHAEIQRLKEESAEWKARYTKTRMQLKNVRLSTIGLNVGGNATKGLKDQTFYSTDGLVKDVHVTRFQLSIDELLSSARTQEPTAVLEHINELVTAVRSITGDVDKAVDDDKNDETTRKRNKLRAKVSATANNVITASKNYAVAQGLSPVSLLDAAASHLSAAVVELVRIARIRSTPIGEFADDGEAHMTPVNKNGYFNLADNMRRVSAADSIYSALSDPPELDPRTPVAPAHDQTHVNGNGYNGLGINSALQEDTAELEELKVYLGNHTDLLVQHIQTLVGAVRNEEQMPNIRRHANGILDVVDIILAAVEGGCEQATSFQQPFTTQVMPLATSLDKSKESLEQIVHDSVQHDGKPSAKEVSQRLPPLAFQIAREAKDLTAKADGVMSGGRAAVEDFS